MDKINRRYRKNSATSRHLKLSVRRKANKGQNLGKWRERRKQEIQNQGQSIDCETSSLNNLHSAIASEISNEKCHSKCDDQGTPKTLDIEKVISGKRIVDVAYFLKKLQTLNKHSPIGCTFSDMQIISEKRQGLVSGFKMKCRMCNYVQLVWLEKVDNITMSSSTAAVSGIMKIGRGYSNMKVLFSILNIPSISIDTFTKEQEKISEATALNEMKIPFEEKKSAIIRGDVDPAGIPLLRVVVDGTWVKKSHKSNYASLSGVDKDLLEKWNQAIPQRAPLKPSYTVCELHFSEKCIERAFETEMPDGTVSVIERGRCQLKPGSVPSVFHNIPDSSKKVKEEKPFTSSLPLPAEYLKVELITDDENLNLVGQGKEQINNSKLVSEPEEQPFSFSKLESELDKVEKPNTWWTVSSIPTGVICVKWDDAYREICKVTIDELLSIQVFLENDEITSSVTTETELQDVESLSRLLMRLENFVIHQPLITQIKFEVED